MKMMTSAADKSSPSLTDIQFIILVVGMFEFLLFHLLASDRKRLYALLPQIFKNEGGDDTVMMQEEGDASVCRADGDVVLSRLGMLSSGAGEAMSFDLWEVFEEEKPRLAEVKEAFDVFDVDRDGFIDAYELQKVMCSLGFYEGFKLDNCRAMIAEFDRNGDHRIDFDEFIRFMDSSFC